MECCHCICYPTEACKHSKSESPYQIAKVPETTGDLMHLPPHEVKDTNPYKLLTVPIKENTPGEVEA